MNVEKSSIVVDRAVLRHYLKIYQLAASPDGHWLAASDNLSRLCLFNLGECLSNSLTDDSRVLSHFIQLEFPAFTLKTVDQLLICGDSHGNLFAYNWSTLIKKKKTDRETVFRTNPFEGTSLSVPGPHELNAILYSDENKRLYIGGAGDNSIRQYDLENPVKPIHTYAGHTSHINDLASSEPSNIVSASHDGTVRIWDARDTKIRKCIEVAEEPKVSRPSIGKSVTSLAVSDKFLVCGGGPQLGIWHLDTYSVAGVLEAENVKHLTCVTKDDVILTGGMSPTFSQWDLSAKIRANMKGKFTAIYCAENVESNWFVAGGGHFIDVYLNLAYCCYSLNAFP